MKQLLATTMLGAVLATPAVAQTKLTLVEVITSPPRTELLQSLVDGFEAANPDIEVEIISLPWGEAFEKLAVMVQGGQTIDVVEMPERWMSLYANNGQLVDMEAYVPGLGRQGHGQRSGDRVRPRGRRQPAHGALRLLSCVRCSTTRLAVRRRPAFRRAAGDLGRLRRRGRGGDRARRRQDRLLPARRTRRHHRLAASDDRDGRVGPVGSTRTASSIFYSDAAKAGAQMLVDIYQNGWAPRDSVNWGFNEIVAGFYSGNCAMLDQDPDALIAVSQYMDPNDFAVAPLPLGPNGKSYPSIGYAGWSMMTGTVDQEAAFEADRPSCRAARPILNGPSWSA